MRKISPAALLSDSSSALAFHPRPTLEKLKYRFYLFTSGFYYSLQTESDHTNPTSRTWLRCAASLSLSCCVAPHCAAPRCLGAK